MGSSTTSIQSVVDLMSTMGSLSVAQAAGGFSQVAWLAIANDVVNDLVSQKFNWKWNSFKVPPFWTTSYQCDYAFDGQTEIGWLESGMWTDINNTSLPLPRWTVEVVRDLQPTSWAASPPTQVCWKYNKLLEQGKWPGVSTVYTQPLGAISTPQNPPTNIVDTDGNILILTTYGTTAATGTGPNAGLTPTYGTEITDGSCIWTVVDPDAQGVRVNPMPPATGVVYQIDLIAQLSAPKFTSLNNMIDPIPDDYSGSFRQGVYAYCHKYSNDPMLKREFPMVRQAWLDEIMAAMKQGDREMEGAGFVPSRSAMSGTSSYSVGPANPYGSGWPGR
jgi:hypothetical protein